ncbi:hypothetical protein FRC02_011656 [Tulasnella sp. 418]|nr:hypothetical protein FRC02_011656 [Tulasnella sp. 418]
MNTDNKGSSDNQKKRRRKPPTFPHHHPALAKKLKQSWVEKKKVQRSYKLLKRRDRYHGTGANMAGDGALDAGWPRRDVAHEGSDDDQDSDESDHVPTKRQKVDAPQPQSSRRKGEQRDMEQTKPTSSEKGNQEKDQESDRKSISQLVKNAYAPSNLHTFKSDPMHRRNHAADTKHGKGRPAATNTSRGRGQPNMKLRMGALLEQIKRTTKAKD